ncbi:hypothetical protein [Nocardia sp. NPDC057455]
MREKKWLRWVDIGKFASGLRWETVTVVASSASAAVYCTRLAGFRLAWRV